MSGEHPATAHGALSVPRVANSREQSEGARGRPHLPKIDSATAETILVEALSQVGYYAHAVGLQASRLTPTRQEPVWSRDFIPDAILMAYALRGLLRAADLVQRLSGAPSASRAITTFKRAVPNITVARDVLAHFDEYLLGTGRNREAPNFHVHLKYDGKRTFLYVDPWSIEVQRAGRAAGKLMMKLWLDTDVQLAAGVLKG